MATSADGTGLRPSRHPHGLRVAAGVALQCTYDIACTCGLVAGPHLEDGVAVGGHSLGGVAASQVATGDVGMAALVFRASYPLADLSERTDLAVDRATAAPPQTGPAPSSRLPTRRWLPCGRPAEPSGTAPR
jgi:hypothetical protein